VDTTASVPKNATDWSPRFGLLRRPTLIRAARAQAIAALVALGVDGSVDLALAALRDPDWGMRTIVASEIGPRAIRILEKRAGSCAPPANCDGSPQEHSRGPGA
jgi:hypothetical protein